MSMCLNCNDANQLYDQATKKCINCSVPGLASMNTSGWTSTTYPVETCTPCDATKNEYAKGTGGYLGFEEGRTCTTCAGTIGLSENANYLGTKDVVCTACPTNALFNTVTNVCDCPGTMSTDKKTCTPCNGEWNTTTKTCSNCIGVWGYTKLSPNVKICTPCKTWTTTTYREFLTNQGLCQSCSGKSVSEDGLNCNSCPGT